MWWNLFHRLVPDTTDGYAGISPTRVAGYATFTFPFSLPGPNSTKCVERTPVSSRRSSVVILDPPTRISPTAKSRPVPLTLEFTLCENVGNARTPTLVLRLSPKNLPSGDMLAAKRADWTDAATISVAATPMLCLAPEQSNAPLPRFTSEPSGPPSDSHDNKGSRTICMGSPRRTYLLPRGGPSFPRRFPYDHAPARVSRNLRMALDAARTFLSLRERDGRISAKVRGSGARGAPALSATCRSTRSCRTVVQLPNPSKASARRRSERCRHRRVLLCAVASR